MIFRLKFFFAVGIEDVFHGWRAREAIGLDRIFPSTDRAMATCRNLTQGIERPDTASASGIGWSVARCVWCQLPKQEFLQDIRGRR